MSAESFSTSNPAECYSRYSRSSLAQQGNRPESDYVFFYGHQKKSGGNAVFSNWYALPNPIVDRQGREFPTMEHYMMVGKAELFGDVQAAENMLRCETPGKAKALGRKVRNFDDTVWKDHARRIVEDGCMLKFSQDKRCMRLLLDTEDKILVEASMSDQRWGIGMNASDPRRLNPGHWNGENWLGEVLMIVRERLRKNQAGDKGSSKSDS